MHIKRNNNVLCFACKFFTTIKSSQKKRCLVKLCSLILLNSMLLKFECQRNGKQVNERREMSNKVLLKETLRSGSVYEDRLS